MAKNYTITEVVKIVSEGKDITAIADIGKRFPVLLHFVTAVAAKAGDDFVEFMSFMPEYLTANKINSVIKSSISEVETEQEQPEEADTEAEVEQEQPAPKKRGRKPKKAENEPEKVEEAEEKEDDKESESENKYAGKKAMELYSECKKRGIKVEPRKTAKYYIDLLVDDDAKDDDEDDWGEEEEVKPAPAPAPKQKKSGKAKPEPKKEAPVEEDDEDDWDI